MSRNPPRQNDIVTRISSSIASWKGQRIIQDIIGICFQYVAGLLLKEEIDIETSNYEKEETTFIATGLEVMPY